MNPNFRTALKNGDVLIGTLITMPVPEIAEIMIEVGFDWLFVDTEHAPFNAKDALRILQTAGPAMREWRLTVARRPAAITITTTVRCTRSFWSSTSVILICWMRRRFLRVRPSHRGVRNTLKPRR